MLWTSSSSLCAPSSCRAASALPPGLLCPLLPLGDPGEQAGDLGNRGQGSLHRVTSLRTAGRSAIGEPSVRRKLILQAGAGGACECDDPWPLSQVVALDSKAQVPTLSLPLQPPRQLLPNLTPQVFKLVRGHRPPPRRPGRARTPADRRTASASRLPASAARGAVTRPLGMSDRDRAGRPSASCIYEARHRPGYWPICGTVTKDQLTH